MWWRIRGRIFDGSPTLALGILVPYATYPVAEAIHASGILAFIAAGLYIGPKLRDLNNSVSDGVLDYAPIAVDVSLLEPMRSCRRQWLPKRFLRARINRACHRYAWSVRNRDNAVCAVAAYKFSQSAPPT